MDFKDYWAELPADDKKMLAERLDTSVAYLSQLAYGHRKAGARFLLQIESATDGIVKPSGLRSDYSSSSHEAA